MAAMYGVLILVVVSFVKGNDDAYNVTDVMKKMDEMMMIKIEQFENQLNVMLEQFEKELNAMKEQSEYQVNVMKAVVAEIEDKMGQVAFSAYVNSGEVHPADEDTIPFKGIHLNQGGHYNPTTSVYTCSRSGTYFFTFSLYSGSIIHGTIYYKTTGKLVQDEQTLAEAYCMTYNSDDHICLQCSQSVVTQCHQGSTVRVKSDSSNNQVYGTSSNMDSTFSGFLLYAD